jgi:hypothetical protein
MAKELKPWYAVATPHEDIQKGRLSEAVFAANLWAVVQGTAPDVYTDPDAFFTKTYLTGGLSRVLKKAAEAITGSSEAGDRILSLQTAFGGGKTHALVALWHLAQNCEKIRRSSACADLRKLLGDALPKKVNALAVFTNQTCDATQGRKTPQGIRTRTMWGELALQLGGKALYENIRANDEKQTAPKGLFVEILKEAAPCLILLDEVADYCVAASAVKVHDSTLADQTISFLQELTESAQQVKGVAVVATLPASHIEVASSEKGEEILKRLEKRVGRMAADNTPVADNEIYEVVRRRLFESLGDPKDHEAAADAYMEMYQQHRNEVPTEATRASYRESIVAAFPFHPSLIDALYLRWGSHGDFQRTRGVLRLLASVVADLWKRRKNETQSQTLIQPCHVRWTVDAMHAALTRLWGAQYESVVANDVIGDKANAVLLDEERGQDYVRERIVEGLAAATMLGSFGGQGERAGYSTKDLKLCVGRPGLNWAYSDGALLDLEGRGFYLHAAPAGNLGKRYWFGTKPTLNKLVVQYRNQLSNRDVDPDITEALQKEVRDLRPGPASWRVLVNPEADLPEQKSLTLVVMPPSCAYSDDASQPSLVASPAEEAVMRLSQKCGKKERHYRNTLLFLLPSPRGLGRLRNALREVQVLESVKQDYGSQLDEEQRNDLNGRLTTARKSVTESLGSAYTCAAQIEGQEIGFSQITDTRASFADHLGLVWKHVVEDEEWILRKVGTVTLQKVNLIPERDGVRLKEAVETFLRHTDKPMIASRHAVVEGFSQACKERLVGIGRGLKLDNLQRKWCGEYVNIDPDEEGLWIIPPFSPEAPPTTTGGATGGGTETKPGTQPPTTTSGGAGTGEQPPDKPGPITQPVKKLKVSGAVPIESWHELFRCFVKPSADLKPKRLKLGVDLDLAFDDEQGVSPDSPAIQGMREAARQLGLDIDVEP